MKKIIASILIISLSFGLGSFVAKYYKPFAKAAPLSSTLILDGSSFNDQVRSVVVSGDIAYVGGDFTSVGKESAFGASVDSTTGLLVDGELEIDDVVRASVSDGSGGWYIGGDFTSIDGVSRAGLAHILSDNTVDPTWNPNPDDAITSIAISGSDIYVAGSFSIIGGQVRAGLAKLNNTNGNADATWNPGADDQISNLVVSGSDIYVTGAFGNIGGQARAGVAKLNNTNGNADATWNPDSDGAIYAITILGSDIYLGGSFTNIGGEDLNNLAKVNNTNADADPTWAPDPDDEIAYLASVGSNIYVAGYFTTIGGESLETLAKLNNTNGNADPTWNPNSDDSVTLIAISGSDIYVGGVFTTIGGQTRAGVAKLNNTNGNADATWNPNPSGTANSLAIFGSEVYIAGDFNSVGGVLRNHLAAIDLTTNQLTDWDPNADDDVYTIAISGDDVYVGGQFESIVGEARANIAKLNIDTGALDPTWDASPVSGGSDKVQAILVSGSSVYVAGGFTAIGGISRDSMAKLNDTDGAADPAFDMSAHFNGFESLPHIDILGSDLYIAGSFSITSGAEQYDRIVKVNKATGVVDETWLGSCSACGAADGALVKVISPYIYFSGNFASYDGTPTGRLVRLNLDGSLDDTWTPNSGNTVNTIVDSGSDLYVGGAFSTIGGQSRNKIAKLNDTDGSADLDWNPDLNATVQSMAFYNNSLLVGGGFTNGLVRFDFSTVGFSSTQGTLGEGTSDPSIALSLSSASDIDTTVTYSISGGTATSGTDFSASPTTVTIPAGNSTVNLPIVITDDSAVEGDETIVITLSSATNLFLGDNTTYTHTIVDNDHNAVMQLPSNNSQPPPIIQIPDPIPVPVPVTEQPQVPIASPIELFKLTPSKFLRDLWYGKTGADVSLLQQFLNERNFILANSGAGSPGHETNYFGPRTQRALKKFQAAYKDSLHKVSGYLDTSTRNLINSLF